MALGPMTWTPRWLRVTFVDRLANAAACCSRRDITRLFGHARQRRPRSVHWERPGRRGDSTLARINGRPVSEADLHAYIDGGLGPLETMEVEAFLAGHPQIARRIEAYRSQVVAVNAAFGAGATSLPPALARLAARYARAVSSSTLVGAGLGIGGLIAILCAMAGAALGASLS